MGPRSDSGSVVNNELFVYGVQGLRVADLSVMPVMVGDYLPEAYLIGERAAALIKKMNRNAPN